MTQKELDKIIEQHQHWIHKDMDGWEDMKADLSNQYLHGLNMRGAALTVPALSVPALTVPRKFVSVKSSPSP